MIWSGSSRVKQQLAGGPEEKHESGVDNGPPQRGWAVGHNLTWVVSLMPEIRLIFQFMS